MKSDKTIIFRTFSNITDATFAKELLLQNGLECFISNEFGNQLYPIFGSSVSGIYLHIFADDEEKAKEILGSFGV